MVVEPCFNVPKTESRNDSGCRTRQGVLAPGTKQLREERDTERFLKSPPGQLLGSMNTNGWILNVRMVTPTTLLTKNGTNTNLQAKIGWHLLYRSCFRDISPFTSIERGIDGYQNIQ